MSTGYSGGHFLGRHLGAVVIGSCVLVGGIYLLGVVADQRAVAKAEAAVAVQKANRERAEAIRKANCTTEAEQLRGRARAALAKGDPELAFRELKGCSNYELEPSTTQLLEVARLATAAKLEKSLAAEQAARLAREKSEKAEALASKIRAKKQGVAIGMTQDQVLGSSWGKPQSINRSTYSFGVHEQWVYGSGNYLYFKDGKLDSIQN